MVLSAASVCIACGTSHTPIIRPRVAHFTAEERKELIPPAQTDVLRQHIAATGFIVPDLVSAGALGRQVEPGITSHVLCDWM